MPNTPPPADGFHYEVLQYIPGLTYSLSPSEKRHIIYKKGMVSCMQTDRQTDGTPPSLSCPALLVRHNAAFVTHKNTRLLFCGGCGPSVIYYSDTKQFLVRELTLIPPPPPPSLCMMHCTTHMRAPYFRSIWEP